ncbi:sensor domain-containing diguanylate cyclase [Sphingomonas japonica]|nr:diguanylate cyclase [Sphingomonas japonica]
MVWHIRLGLVMAAAGILLAIAPPASAQAWSVGEPVALCVRPDRGESPREILARPTGFDCDPDQRKHGPGDFWAISPPLRTVATPDNALRIRTASLWQGRQTLYAQHADGTIRAFPTSDAAASRRLQLGALFEFAFPADAPPVTRLLWQVEDTPNLRGVVLGARIGSAAASERANLTMAAIYACFVGLCLALLIYNLAMWGALRHRFLLAYCTMVAALLVYAVSSSAALSWMLPDIPNTMRLRINYMTLSLAAIAALFFARSFFEARIFNRRLQTLVTAVSALVLAGGIGMLVTPDATIGAADRFYSIAFLSVPLAVIPILWRAWRERSSYLWLFGLAWAAPIAMAVARALHNIGVLPWNFWLDNSTILAMAVEAMLSSLAIAYRIRLISRERDHAVEQELRTRLLAETDPLTGLLNRRALLSRAIGRAGEQVLLLVDIDHFKRVNEVVGHDGGDEVLQAFANQLAAAVPASGLVARIGGEEFAIVTHLVDAPEPDRLLERLRGATMPFDLSVTASIGACVGPLASDIDWKQLYRCADRALFEAKAGGRNRAGRTGRLAAIA